MAEIEKGLPGETRTQVKVPAEDIEIKEEVQQEKPPVEVIPEEDGGATIDFEPGAINIPGTEKHFDNLIKNIKGFAGGGIAKLAGDPSGAMLQSMNPDSQGLRSLKKRVKTI